MDSYLRPFRVNVGIQRDIQGSEWTTLGVNRDLLRMNAETWMEIILETDGPLLGLITEHSQALWRSEWTAFRVKWESFRGWIDRLRVWTGNILRVNGPLYRHIQRLNGALSELNGKYSGRWMNRFLSDIQGTSGTALRVKWKASQWPSEGFNSNVWENEWTASQAHPENEWDAFRVNGRHSENEWTALWRHLESWMGRFQSEWRVFRKWMERFQRVFRIWMGRFQRLNGPL